MSRDWSKEPRFESSAAARRNGLEDLAESPRMALLVRAAENGDAAALEALVAALTPMVLHLVRAFWGTEGDDLIDVSRAILVAIVDALPSWRADCTLLHFAVRIAARRTVAVPRSLPRNLVARLGWLKRQAMRAASPWEHDLGERRRRFLRQLFAELPEAQGEAMVLRIGLGYSVEEIALISNTPAGVVRGRLRDAKDALASRIESDPTWEEVWGDEV